MANEYKSVYTGEEVDESVEISKKALTTDNIVQTTGPSPSQVMSQQAVTVALRTAKAATVQVGTTTTGPAGSNASVTNSGTEYDAILDFIIPRGDDGEKGNGIVSIEKTSSSGIIDTYTVTYNDGSTDTFQITNGDQIELRYLNGELQWKYETETNWMTLFTTDNSLSATSENPIQNRIVTNALNGKANLTGENVFNGGQTIQGNVFVGGQVNIPNGPVTIQNINVANSITSLQGDVSSINNNINTNLVQSIGTNASGDNVSLIQTLINLSMQATTQQSVNLPLANASAAGLMSSSDFSSLQDLEDRVGNLEGKTTRLLYTASTNPTASDINSFVVGLGYASPFEGIAVVVDETFHIWHYYDNNGIGWRDDGVDTVSNFTNSTAGIILGSTDNGKVFAETDGTGSVNGWDTLNTNVSNLQSTTQALSSSVSTLQNTVSTHTSNISDLQTTTQNLSNTVNSLNTQVGTNTSNITNLQNNKIDINQGSNNTGKVLTVGNDGNVTPQDIPSSGGTVVNVNNVPQATINFTSDPQTQIDEIRESIPTGLPIGSIITSAVPLTDASVHLLDGSTISQTGIYADFVTYLKSQISAGYDLSCTQTEFDNDVQSTGNCGKFVIDDTAGTIRLPKITRFIQGLSSINDIGKSFSAGLPNIYGEINIPNGRSATGNSYFNVSGAFKYKENASQIGNAGNGGLGGRIKIDANSVSGIYGNSSTVQPQATQYPYYIVLADTVKTDIVVDIDNVTTELNNISHELTNKVSKTDYNALGDFVDIFSGSNVSVGSNITLNESMLNFNFLLFRGRNENNGSAVSMVSTDWFYTICDNEINRLVACTDATYCSFIRVNDTTIKVRNFSGGINYITISGIGRKKQ